MRSKIVPAQHQYADCFWHKWFAWYPKKVYLGPRFDNYNRPYQWVWLESIERKRKWSGNAESDDDPDLYQNWFMYRIKPPQGEDPRSSTEFETTGEEEKKC